jgi:hypothetical protein
MRASSLSSTCRTLFLLRYVNRFPNSRPSLSFTQTFMVASIQFTDVWQEKCETYGSLLKNGVEVIATMLAVGLGLESTFFTDAGRHGCAGLTFCCSKGALMLSQLADVSLFSLPFKSSSSRSYGNRSQALRPEGRDLCRLSFRPQLLDDTWPKSISG